MKIDDQSGVPEIDHIDVIVSYSSPLCKRKLYAFDKSDDIHDLMAVPGGGKGGRAARFRAGDTRGAIEERIFLRAVYLSTLRPRPGPLVDSSPLFPFNSKATSPPLAAKFMVLSSKTEFSKRTK